MVEVDDLIKWLKRHRGKKKGVAVDEGGLTLVIVDDDGNVTNAYYEIGGVDRDDEEVP